MSINNYVPGTWFGIVRARTAVLLGPETPAQLVGSLWELLETGPEVHELLHAVTSSYGVSLAQIPSFGIVDFHDSLHVFLRGDIDLTAQLPTGPLELHGRDVTTWTERRLTSANGYRITVPNGGPEGRELPLHEGIVLLQSLTTGLNAAPAAPAALTSVPGPVTPAPEVETPVAAAAAAAPEPAPEPDQKQEPERGQEPEPEQVPVQKQEVRVVSVTAPEGALGGSAADHHSTEHGASAETVIGVLDEDEDFPSEPRLTSSTPDAAREPDRSPEPGAAPEREAAPDQPVPADEQTGTYDHLWERTVVRSIEDAAVRDDPDDEEDSAASSAPAIADASQPGTEPVLLEAALGNAPETGPVPDPPVQTPPAPVPPVTAGGLIDSVPWNTGGQAKRSEQPPVAFVDPAAGSRPAAVPLPPASAGHAGIAPVAAPEIDDSDHDGQTIMKSDLAGMAAHPAPAAAVAAEPNGPLVLARVCGQGHANPPTHSQCAVCGRPLPSDGIQVARPRLGRMRVSTGELVDLDQSLVIGRQPSVSRVQGGVMPRLVQVASPTGDISRSHVEVRLEGWHVMLCDLKATNGTVLVREGQPPRRLAQNEMAILLDGDIAELGDGISLRFEEIL